MSLEAASTSDVARLIREHQAGVWRYLRALGCQPAQAEDLTQETFLAVLQRPFVDHGRAATAGYLRKIARNQLISARRRSSRYSTVDDIEGTAEGIAEIERQWEQLALDEGDDAVEALKDCLEGLDERSRKSLELRFSQQKSRTEIAASLGMTEDGAKNLMQRAKQRLRECIQRKLRQE
jgi:RNA polymerase sigma-70 factor (ECF subfamily)